MPPVETITLLPWLVRVRNYLKSVHCMPLSLEAGVSMIVSWRIYRVPRLLSAVRFNNFSMLGKPVTGFLYTYMRMPLLKVLPRKERIFELR